MSGFADKIEGFASRVYKLYTMANERDIHVRYFPANNSSSQASAPAAASAQADDDDLFADALF